MLGIQPRSSARAICALNAEPSFQLWVSTFHIWPFLLPPPYEKKRRLSSWDLAEQGLWILPTLPGHTAFALSEPWPLVPVPSLSNGSQLSDSPWAPYIVLASIQLWVLGLTSAPSGKIPGGLSFIDWFVDMGPYDPVITAYCPSGPPKQPRHICPIYLSWTNVPERFLSTQPGLMVMGRSHLLQLDWVSESRGYLPLLDYGTPEVRSQSLGTADRPPTKGWTDNS